MDGGAGAAAPPLKLSIVGCGEGTHGKVWAEMLTAPDGARFGMRPTRVWDARPEAAEQVARATGAEVVADPRAAGDDVDGVLITDLMPDGYLALARPFLEAGRRVFLNRPFAGSVADARAILDLAARHDARVYSASALYHTAAGDAARAALPGLGPIRLFNVVGPSDHLVFYLPHAIAALVSVLGPGVTTVQALSLETRPEEPRLATGPVVLYLRYGPQAAAGARGALEMVGPGARWYGFRLKLFGLENESEEVRFEVSYDALLHRMAAFFRTGEEPVPRAVLLEKTAIHYAALFSAKRGGRPVDVPELIRRG